MISYHRILCLLCLVIVFTGVSVSGLAINADRKSSSSARIVKKQLSDEEHYSSNSIHNRDFDHEAFLGSEDEANEFDQLSPEESKRRLGIIVDRIDSNHDGNVTEVELKNWIQLSQRRYVLEDLDRQWDTHTDHNPAVRALSWEQFKNKTYGFLDKVDFGKERTPEDLKTYVDMLRRDERRWQRADQDGDGRLTRDEFALFLHPEESEHMHDVVVEETLEDIDLDHDGRISESEYISDMYTGGGGGHEEDTGHSGHVPEWVLREREQFRVYRDHNKDGYLDRREIREWIVPANYDHADAEAKHLLFEADQNKDGVLSKEEVLENYDVFVGSQVTEFGEAFSRHDEF